MIRAVINPAGSGGGTMKVWKQAEKILNERKVPYQAHFSTREHGIGDIVRELTDTDEPVTLLILGGDGTMNNAVNGIVNFDMTKVGFISCGSGNDLARSLDLPKDINDCMDLILRDEIRHTLDVGEVVYHNRYDESGRLISEEDTVRRFNISSGIGFDAEICANAEKSSFKKTLNAVKLGRLIYLSEGVKVIFNTVRARTHMKIEGVGPKEYGALLFAAAMNEPYEGGGFRFGPEADPSDGYLDLCIGDDLSQFDFFRIFPYAYSGSHVRFKGVYVYRTKNAEIRTDQPLWVHTDGEIECKSSHITLRTAAYRLKMLL